MAALRGFASFPSLLFLICFSSPSRAPRAGVAGGAQAGPLEYTSLCQEGGERRKALYIQTSKPYEVDIHELLSPFFRLEDSLREIA